MRDLDAGKKRDVAYHAGALLTALGHAIGDICIDLVTAYAVDAETYSRDVLVFANDLIRRGLAKAA